MLVGESCDAQTVRRRAARNARPIDVHRDVCVTDFLKGGIEMSVLGANLNACLKLIARMSIVDRDRIASLQVRSEVVDPIERSLIKLRV